MHEEYLMDGQSHPMTATQIYFVETHSEEKRHLLCQWAEHFYEEGRKVQIVVDSTTAAQYVDELLWSFSQASFVPHRVFSANSPSPVVEPVVITVGAIPLEGFQVLVADGSIHLDFIQRYEAAVHFVLMDDDEKRQESRIMWQAAKDRGFAARHVPRSPNAGR